MLWLGAPDRMASVCKTNLSLFVGMRESCSIGGCVVDLCVQARLASSLPAVIWQMCMASEPSSVCTHISGVVQEPGVHPLLRRFRCFG